MAEIVDVVPDSIGAQLQLKAGDRILTINGRELKDYIDYRYEIADSRLDMEIKKKNGDLQSINLEKDYGQNLGLRFNSIIFDELMYCCNNCIFCFVDQLPLNVRDSLQIKDDDYRFSFLQGSYITLTNLERKDFDRIINLNLSPLYISIHTTDNHLRGQMMKNPAAGKIKEQLTELSENGIDFHGQIVLCPGINDGEELTKTLSELIHFYPSLLSLGIVPVGLTAYSSNGLTSYNTAQAQNVLKKVREWQERYRNELGENIIYAADEFYLLAGDQIPEYEHYQSFPQFENGIGMTRSLWQEFEELKPELSSEFSRKNTGILTGKLGAQALQPIVYWLNQNRGTKIELIPVKNIFFGNTVTVTGLLTGTDIINTIERNKTPETLIIPGVMLNDKGYFLDDMKLEEIKHIYPENKFIICNSLAELIEVIVNE
ncbi:MAG: DUF512 domain-containing protein [Halanaerobiaceae bacterium]